MTLVSRWLCGWLAVVACAAALAGEPASPAVAAAERSFLDLMDAGELAADDRLAIAAMRRSIAAFDDGNPDDGAPGRSCRDAKAPDASFDALREALVDCFVEHGNQLRFEGTTIDRGTALQLLHVVGVETKEVERWLVLVLEAWRRPVARVVASYPTGGLFSLNELVHEIGHAVHVSAIHTRPAYMDWPDTLFTEAFADVPSWSVHEPAWQRRHLGVEAPEAESLRALFGNVVLDVAWSLFELRLLRDPQADPNAVWTDITSRYLRIVPHPEVPWWAMRVQLVSDPGYMVNYGLGAILTAEMRARTVEALGPFDAGNPQWFEWLGGRLLRHGSELDTRSLMSGLLGRQVAPQALLQQIERCRPPR